MKLFFLISFAMMLKCTLSLTNYNQTHSEPKDDRSLQKIWIANSIIGVFGIVLNSLVLLIFFQERTKLVTSVNAMIMSVFYFPFYGYNFNEILQDVRCILYALLNSGQLENFVNFFW